MLPRIVSTASSALLLEIPVLFTTALTMSTLIKVLPARTSPAKYYQSAVASFAMHLLRGTEGGFDIQRLLGDVGTISAITGQSLPGLPLSPKVRKLKQVGPQRIQALPKPVADAIAAGSLTPRLEAPTPRLHRSDPGWSRCRVCNRPSATECCIEWAGRRRDPTTADPIYDQLPEWQVFCAVRSSTSGCTKQISTARVLAMTPDSVYGGSRESNGRAGVPGAGTGRPRSTESEPVWDSWAFGSVAIPECTGVADSAERERSICCWWASRWRVKVVLFIRNLDICANMLRAWRWSKDNLGTTAPQPKRTGKPEPSA